MAEQKSRDNTFHEFELYTLYKNDGYYICFATDGVIFLDLDLEGKHHDPLQFNLTKDNPKIATLIEDSYNYSIIIPS